MGDAGVGCEVVEEHLDPSRAPYVRRHENIDDLIAQAALILAFQLRPQSAAFRLHQVSGEATEPSATQRWQAELVLEDLVDVFAGGAVVGRVRVERRGLLRLLLEGLFEHLAVRRHDEDAPRLVEEVTNGGENLYDLLG